MRRQKFPSGCLRMAARCQRVAPIPIRWLRLRRPISVRSTRLYRAVSVRYRRLRQADTPQLANAKKRRSAPLFHFLNYVVFLRRINMLDLPDLQWSGAIQKSRQNCMGLGGNTLMKKIIVAAASIAAAFMIGPVNAQTPPIVIKFSHVVAPQPPKDKEEGEALQLGAVQMLAPSLAKFGPLGVREFEVFDIPYIMPDKAALNRVTHGEVGKKLLAKLEPKGIKGLAYWDNGFKIMSANKPLHKPEDFHGLKMRIQSSKVIEAQMRALGSIPQVMAFSEVYQALQTGVVDGTENPPSNMNTQMMNEVQKHATLSNHGYLGYAVIVNKKFWEGLPADGRGQLEKAMADATTSANDIAQKETDDALAAMQKAGTTTFYKLTPEETAAWKKVLDPVADEVGNPVGKDLIAEFRKEAAASAK